MRLTTRTAIGLLGFALFPAVVSAELRHVQITVTGLDCASCARAMIASVRKLEGVESVEVSPEKGLVEIALKADNTVTLPQLRRTIRSNGNETKHAQIAGRGRIVERDGTPILDLLNGATMEIASRPSDAPTGVVDLTGVATEQAGNLERVTIIGIKPAGQTR